MENVMSLVTHARTHARTHTHTHTHTSFHCISRARAILALSRACSLSHTDMWKAMNVVMLDVQHVSQEACAIAVAKVERERRESD